MGSYSRRSVSVEHGAETTADHGGEHGVEAVPQPLAAPVRTAFATAFDNRRVAGRESAATVSARFWKDWLEHKEYLGNLAYRWMSGNRADAEDVLSRAAIKAHDRFLRDCTRIRNLKAWLARLVHNACMDEHRKRMVRNRISEQFHPDQLENMLLQGSICIPAHQSFEAADDLTQAYDIIMEMPDRLRKPFVLRFIYQYDNQEIARLLSLTEVNVRKRIQLGRTLVKSRLQMDVDMEETC